jgi:hypothetical protein
MARIKKKAALESDLLPQIIWGLRVVVWVIFDVLEFREHAG